MAGKCSACVGIREELASLYGCLRPSAGARRHLDVCADCAEFLDRVRVQRAMLALLLPVAPSLVLRSRVMATVAAARDQARPPAAGRRSRNQSPSSPR